MRTTLDIEDAVLREARQAALSAGTTLTAFIEQALREALARKKDSRHPGKVRLPTLRGSRLRPGIDLDDTSALLDALEAVRMDLVDVNVLIYAFWEGAEEHAAYRGWLVELASGDEPFGMSDLVLSSFVRTVTSPRVLDPPAPLAKALEFVERLRERPSCIAVSPGSRHWPIFRKLCADSAAKGNLVADAFLAALAIESGCEWVTTDRDYARFAGLRTRHPLRG